MNFETIRSQIGRYETKSDASIVAVQMQSLIAKNGFDVFKNIELLNEEIKELQLSSTIKAQLSLIFSCSTLPDFILNSKSDLNMVDIDNAVHSVVNSTGLSYKCVIMLIADVFYACGLNFAIEYGPHLAKNNVENRLHALMPSAMVEKEVKNTKLLIAEYAKMVGKDQDESTKKAATDAVLAIRKLCDAGIAEGFFLLGKCYLYGDCGTEIDKPHAFELMKTAAYKGIPEAAAILGDIHYNSDDPLMRDYTLAHHYYTRPGAMALGATRRSSLQDIYKQCSANKTTLVFSGIIFALMIAFLTYFNTGLFSESSRLGIGIFFTVISAAVYGMSILYNRVKGFNGIRWVVAVQYFIWALYAFILILA